jgi:hypothetical protein
VVSIHKIHSTPYAPLDIWRQVAAGREGAREEGREGTVLCGIVWYLPT